MPNWRVGTFGSGGTAIYDGKRRVCLIKSGDDAERIVRSVNEASGWMPIHTAPTDGSQVDLWITPTGPALSAGPCREPNCWWFLGEWRCYVDPSLSDDCTAIVSGATHWRPIPEGPSDE